MANELKVAIVTGGAQGLGAAICTELLKERYRVCVADIQREKGEDFLKEKQLEFGKDRVLYSYCDVSKEEKFDETFRETLETYKRIDVLVNNAGIIDEDSPTNTLKVNLLGVINGIAMAFRYMGKCKGQNGGIVINTASRGGFVPMAFAPNYCASKHAVIGLTRSYGLPFHFEKEGIIFVAICPTAIDTELVRKQGRFIFLDPKKENPLMSPDYVAKGVLKVLEDRVNGSTLVIADDKGYQYVGVQEEFKDILEEMNKIF